LLSLFHTTVFTAPRVFSQTPAAASFLQLLPRKNDTIKITILRNTGFDYYRTKAAKSAVYLKETIVLVKRKTSVNNLL